jgi:outer membrane protein TolC
MSLGRRKGVRRGVASARKARDLSQRTFEITVEEQELGAGSNYQTLEAQRDLVVSESALVAATAKIVDTGNEIC